MKLVVDRALRLVREDLARLGDVHRRQLVQAIAPGKPDVAEDLVEAKEADGGDVRGLVYVRFHDAAAPARAYEGWLLDDARFPERRASPDGGAFFVAGTLRSAGVDMSQASVSARRPAAAALRDAIAAMVRDLRVTTRGPALKEDPPFAHEKAPKPVLPKQDAGALTLRVLSARRYTEAQLRAAKPHDRFQLLHSLRPKFATKTMADMEDTFALGMLWDSFDPGPDTASATSGHRSGVFHVRLADANDPSRELDAWFRDERSDDAESYWPSARASATAGRVLLARTVTFTGVEVSKGRVRVDAKKALPFAEALAKGLKKLGLTFDVEVVPAPKGKAKGYFGSKGHKKQLEETRRYDAMQAKWLASKKKKKKK